MPHNKTNDGSSKEQRLQAERNAAEENAKTTAPADKKLSGPNRPSV